MKEVSRSSRAAAWSSSSTTLTERPSWAGSGLRNDSMRNRRTASDSRQGLAGLGVRPACLPQGVSRRRGPATPGRPAPCSPPRRPGAGPGTPRPSQHDRCFARTSASGTRRRRAGLDGVALEMAPDVAGEAAGRLVASRPVLLERLHHDPVEIAAHQPGQPRRLDFRDAATDGKRSRESLSRVLGLGGSSSRMRRRISESRPRAAAPDRAASSRSAARRAGPPGA